MGQKNMATEQRKDDITALIDYNRNVIRTISDKHSNLKNLNWYIGTDTRLTRQPYLRETLQAVYKFIADKKLWALHPDGYVFFVDTVRLTYKVRRKTCGKAISNRHINLLCALGLFEKVNLNEEDYKRILKPRLKPQDRQRPVNAFLVQRYDKDTLDYIENRARRLKEAEVTSGNIGQSYLENNGLADIAREVYYANNKNAPTIKLFRWQSLQEVIQWLIDEQGYTTKEEIKANSLMSDWEIERLFTIFKRDLLAEYNYKAPTKEQRDEFNLQSRHWIITAKE